MNLENCDLFLDLPSQSINKIIEKIPYKIRKYNKNDFIYTPYNYSRELGIILKGSVSIYKDLYNGDKFLLNKLEENSILGVDYIYEKTSILPGEAQATKPTEILFLSQESLDKLFILDEKILKNFFKIMSSQILFLNNKLEIIALPSIKDRLEFLIDRKIYSQKTLKTVNKTQLCYELGTSRSSLYRAINELNNKI